MRFKCQESCGGKCCTANWNGKASFVFLTYTDIRRLMRFLKKPPSEFVEYGEFTSTRFTDKTTHQYFLKNNVPSCQFLKDGKCSVYEARPTQCRTFPFWPENMEANNWEKLVEFCPGIGHGNEHTDRKFRDQKKADEDLRCNLPK